MVRAERCEATFDWGKIRGWMHVILADSLTKLFLMFLRSISALILSLSALSAKVSFNDDIRPLLSNHCYRCHGPDEEDRKAKLRLDTREGAMRGHNGFAAIVPGNLDDSELIYRIVTDDEDEVMPPPGKGERFTKEQIALFKQWIEEGAEYEVHWSYTKPVRPEIPKVEETVMKVRSPIDAFILDRLKKEGLDPSEEADRYTLIRRVTLDLTGVPPTVEEVDAFVADQSPDAYEKLIDRLLAKPAFGEHWARMWLDLARYADSAGYADDPSRTIWAYRDWVIRAFNANMPFDQFTIEQIAGDLLPDPTEEQLIATAFHRNTKTNNEGGTSDEEFRNAAVVDRVNTTMATWMGTTAACAQCHTHKYDPITHEEYFQMFAIFNQSEDADRRNEAPIINVSVDSGKRAKLEAEIAALEKAALVPDANDLAELAKWESGLKSKPTKWQVLAPTKMTATSGATFTLGSDKSVLVGGKVAKTDHYAITASSDLKQITALKIETLAYDQLKGGGPGRKENFVLNEVALSGGGNSNSKRGRFVRIELPGNGRILHVAEVQAFDAAGVNVALKGKAKQSTTGYGGEARLAIDGNTNGIFTGKSITHTNDGDKAPYWEVDLGAEYDLSRLAVWNRTDNNLQSRLDGFKLSVLDAKRVPVWEQTFAKGPQREQAVALDGAQRGSFASASATYEQKDFSAPVAIDGSPDNKSGWAVGGATGKDHHAVFRLAKPLPGGALKIELAQMYPDHAIGRFRISVTDAAEPAPAVPQGIAAIMDVPAAKRDANAKAALFAHYLKANPAALRSRGKIAALKKQIATLKPGTTVPIMRDLPENKHRKTHIQLRGSYLSLGDEVGPGVPEVFGALPKGSNPDRLAMAKWLVNRDNPLTARVVANRFWENLFGVGIVLTSEEFGSQGERPSHPELLDWLAIEFMDGDWDMKKFLRLLVTSSAYRQNSHVTSILAQRDPDNRLVARGPRVRLTAEMIRDQALAVSGLLSPKMFGAPVRPPQPNLGLKAAFGGGTDWKTSAGEDKFRRGVYTSWRRSSPYPSMATFGAPNREVCTVRRGSTNTPLQALVTLNDPVYIEAAQALARRMAAQEGTVSAKINHGFRLSLARPPKDGEIDRLVALYDSTRTKYAADTKLAKEMATNPIGPAPKGADFADLAALTVVGNVLLNLDETLMKR